MVAIFSFTMACPLEAQAQHSCSGAFGREGSGYLVGSPEKPPEGLDYKYKYFALGEGGSGKVWRAIERSSYESHIVKKYKLSSTLRHDLRAFELLQGLGLSSVRFPEILAVKEKKALLYLKDVKGYSLSHLMENPELVDDWVLTLALEKYHHLLADLRTKIKEKFPRLKILKSDGPFLLVRIDDRKSKDEPVFIKLYYDQVILERDTYDLYWVDPV